jgi:hypothetical protein
LVIIAPESIAEILGLGSSIRSVSQLAGALLAMLVHANLGMIPKTHRVVRIEIPEAFSLETILPEQVPGWDAEDRAASRGAGMRGSTQSVRRCCACRAW